jgi:deazaflavin-dependent oxidoreductase (nitroreductase family)
MAQASRRDPVRSLSNRIFLAISGKWFRAYSIVGHVGRTSGREYRNPVSAYPLGDGFVIPVLYGAGSQWVRNVMAAGRFTLRTKGRDYPLERPEIIPAAQALAAFPPLRRRLTRSQRTQDFVWAHRARPAGQLIQGRTQIGA